MRGSVWLVDDDREMRSVLEEVLTGQGYAVRAFPSAIDALNALRAASTQPDLILTDIQMANLSGLELLQECKKIYPLLPVILITAFASVDSAVEAIKQGAETYIVKPFKMAELLVHVQRAVDRGRVMVENENLRAQIRKERGLGDILGKSPQMKAIFDLVQRVALTQSSVLIQGESGTGKELVARAIHHLGPRSEGPFVAINCTAIPENLLESELFGHAKGSFTGATQRKKGLFEEAQGGTLLLDEIGDMSPGLQSKLLRVLQERRIRPVGDTSSHDIDIRLMAATHRDLKAAIREGSFREDLYYRISVIPILIPPLRERRDDIPVLANHFLARYSAQNPVPHNRVTGFTQAAMSKLMSMRWEGNVRELENVVERAVVLCNRPLVDVDDLSQGTDLDPLSAMEQATKEFPSLQELEKRYIRMVLNKTQGKKDRASQILGINRRTLYRKEQEYGW